MEQVATALKLHKLLVVGSSVGGTYALALAAYLPDRVQATLLISPSGSTGESFRLLVQALITDQTTLPRWSWRFGVGGTHPLNHVLATLLISPSGSTGEGLNQLSQGVHAHRSETASSQGQCFDDRWTACNVTADPARQKHR